MKFGIGLIRKSYGLMEPTFPMSATLTVDDKRVEYIIGNFQQHQHLIENETHGMFWFQPQDQFANFIPMSDVSVMLMQGFEAQRLRMESIKANPIDPLAKIELDTQ